MRRLLGAMVIGLVLAAPARAAVIPVTTHVESIGNPTVCSLREAIDAANLDSSVDGCPQGSGADVVRLGTGTYVLSSGGAVDNNNLTGDLDAVMGGGALTIEGAGAARTTISAQGLGDRVVDVLPGVTVTISGVTLTGGTPPLEGGGGIRSGGTLTLIDAAVRGNRAADGSAGSPGGTGHQGGGIASDGALTLVRTTVTDNFAGAGGRGDDQPGVQGFDGGDGGPGGGILAAGDVTIDRSLIVRNHAGAGGRGGDGSIGGDGGDGGDGGGLRATGTLTMTGTLAAANAAGAGGAGGSADSGQGGQGGDGGDGGGLSTDPTATATVAFSTFASNAVGPLGPGGASVAPPSVPGVAGAGSAVANQATTSLARTIAAGTCTGGPTDGGLDLGGTGCPGSHAAPLLAASGVPLVGSPAVDAVPAAGCPATDINGVARPQGLGCDIGAFEARASALAFSPSALAFANTSVRHTRRRALTVRNPGPPGLALGSVSIRGGAFRISADTCAATLLGGRSCAVTVAFKPPARGPFTGTLRIGARSFALRGRGVQCVVPKLRGKTVKKARKALRHRHCRLGKVVRRGHGRPGRIRASKPKAGSVRPAATRVRVVVNRRGG